MKIKNLVIILVLTLSKGLFAQVIKQDKSEIEEVKTLFEDLLKAKDLYEEVDKELIGIEYLAASNTPSSASAIFDLWRHKRAGAVELSWYKQQRRSSRVIVLALFFTQRKVNASNFPDFKTAISRFGEEEKDLRLKELEYVEENIIVIRKSIDEILKVRKLKSKQYK